MKIKKILLGGLVLVFAVGSAIAFAFSYELPHVIGKTSINPGVWTCIPLYDTPYCDAMQGRFECVVRIPVNGIITHVLAYRGPWAISPETQCIFPLRQSTIPAQVATPLVPVYEVFYSDIRY